MHVKMTCLLISSHFTSYRVFVGIKKLLDLIDMARYTEPSHRVVKFLTKMEDEGCLEPIARH